MRCSRRSSDPHGSGRCDSSAPERGASRCRSPTGTSASQSTTSRPWLRSCQIWSTCCDRSACSGIVSATPGATCSYFADRSRSISSSTSRTNPNAPGPPPRAPLRPSTSTSGTGRCGSDRRTHLDRATSCAGSSRRCTSTCSALSARHLSSRCLPQSTAISGVATRLESRFGVVVPRDAESEVLPALRAVG